MADQHLIDLNDRYALLYDALIPQWIIALRQREQHRGLFFTRWGLKGILRGVARMQIDLTADQRVWLANNVPTRAVVEELVVDRAAQRIERERLFVANVVAPDLAPDDRRGIPVAVR